MDPFSNNYVLAIHAKKGEKDGRVLDVDPNMSIGLAWLDLSTGHFFTQQTTLSTLPSYLARIGPKEIVLDEELQGSKDHKLFTVLDEEHYLISYVNNEAAKPISEWGERLESPMAKSRVDQFTIEEVAAANSVLQYVETRLQGSNVKLQPPARQSDVMGIDKNTMRALEIKSTMRDDSISGSILHTIRRTVTKGGARLLGSWLSKFPVSLSILKLTRFQHHHLPT